MRLTFLNICILLLLVVLLTVCLPDLLYSFQAPALPPKPVQTPIDGGLAILAAGGGAYAIKKLRNRHHKDNNTPIS